MVIFGTDFAASPMICRAFHFEIVFMETTLTANDFRDLYCKLASAGPNSFNAFKYLRSKFCRRDRIDCGVQFLGRNRLMGNVDRKLSSDGKKLSIENNSCNYAISQTLECQQQFINQFYSAVGWKLFFLSSLSCRSL